jgi:hypothetical protein
VKTRIRYFDGAEAKLHRLQLGPLLAEVEKRIQSSVVLLAESDRANHATELQDQLGALFAIDKARGGKWSNCRRIGEAALRMEFRMRISSRREILYKDVLHLRRRLECGAIDLGVIVIPSDKLQRFLSGRTPSSSYAEKVIREMDTDRYPIILIELEHDGLGPTLANRSLK